MPVTHYRARLQQSGLAHFEVSAPDTDRTLIRSLVKRLAQADPEATRMGSEVARSVASTPGTKGGILAALRGSPLVGANLKLSRSRTTSRTL